MAWNKGRKRKLRVLERRSGGDGCLSPALGALPQVPVIEPAVLRAAAGGAIESRGPAQPCLRFGAFLLRAEVLQEHCDAHSILELDQVSLRHGFSRSACSALLLILLMFLTSMCCSRKIS